MCVCFFAANSNTIKIKLELLYICVKFNDFIRMSTILPLDIAAVVTVWYLVIYFNNQIRNVEIQLDRVSTFLVFKYFIILQLFALQ